MGSNLREVNIALARCDLERVVGDHLRNGADPGRLLGELLEMCMNLRELSAELAGGGRPGGLHVVECLRPDTAQMDDAPPTSDDSPDFVGMKVSWLRPPGGLSGSPRGHHVEREPDADQGLADD
jgi:hypothetical protein